METLETLLTQCNDDENLLDAAEERWGMEDYRFLALQERPRPDRWTKSPGNPPAERPEPDDEDNELVAWLPRYVGELKGLLAGAGDDEALLKGAEKRLGGYGRLVVRARKIL
ncbi:MAG TPA: hypothetical protein ENK58_10410 [Desulfobacterales bacterium]|nr:hypothetical protein [Desulfobacterales bacterium]